MLKIIYDCGNAQKRMGESKHKDRLEIRSAQTAKKIKDIKNTDR